MTSAFNALVFILCNTYAGWCIAFHTGVCVIGLIACGVYHIAKGK